MIKLKFDSNEKLFLTNFKGELDKEFLDRFNDYVLNKSLDELLATSFDDFTHSYFDENFIFNFYQELLKQRGDVSFSDIHTKQSIVCRCLGVSEKEIRESFHQNFAREEKVYQSLQVSMICSTCQLDVKKIFEKERINFLKNKPLSYYEEKVISELEDFTLHSPYQDNKLQFSLNSISVGKLRIRALRGDKTLKREEITSVLTNYLSLELRQLFEIIIILS